MERSLGLLLLLIGNSAIISIVQARSQQGFISLDCGLPANELSPYKEEFTGLQFSSDAPFIQSGKTGKIQASQENDYLKPYKTLRYFPDGIRNCYNLKVEKGRNLLIRARFVYGNYDGLDISPKFDLYFGPNLWVNINLERQVNVTGEEILHVPTSDSLQICLVKTGTTTPLIASLELRPMRSETYIVESGSLKFYTRLYLTNLTTDLRFPYDVYDRIWSPYTRAEWTPISTTHQVRNSNDYGPPEDALKNAVSPTNASAPLTIDWPSPNPDEQYYFYAHFAEIRDLRINDTREFSVNWNGVHYSFVVPRKLVIDTLQSTSAQTCRSTDQLFHRSAGEGKCSFQLVRTNRSTLPPLLNALEFYTVIEFPQSETDENEVRAIKKIAATYGLSRINWQGDPCVPQQLRWEGLDCRNTMYTPPIITTLNLSSSGLTGTIAAAIQSLMQLEKLDLSNNNLTGGVPEFLGEMKSLSVIILSGNNLIGSIPQALHREGLELLVEGNPKLCLSDSCRKATKNVLVSIVASIISAAVVVAVLVLFLVLKKKNPTILQGLHLRPWTMKSASFANKKSRRFTYSEVIKITNNFQSVLGKGGFGMVYHGTVNGSQQVAIKILSQSSTQGYKEFKAEVELLLRVHHTNLVSLVGYCYEGDHLALVYEFLPNGDLKQHLSRRGGRSIITWSIRLQIALEAGLGLEYLHIGCAPPMVHRDIKTANILLDENFKAKLADFGLSRSFPLVGQSLVSTDVAGTFGYLDPEYHRTTRLSKKSDVYSFGIVLLEMITNQPVINQTTEITHITQWVGFKVIQGDITKIMDPNLCGVYDSNSAWRALELAMSCADPSSSKRPTMSQVINELKECLVCENSRMSNTQGLECQVMSISMDTSDVPRAR